MGQSISHATAIAFKDAVNSCKVDEIASAVCRDPAIVRASLEAGNTAWHLAATSGQVVVLHALSSALLTSAIAKGYTGTQTQDTVQQIARIINGHNSAGLTPLMIACDKGHTEAAMWLLTKGADPWSASESWDGWTPLHFAVRSQHPDTAEALIDYVESVPELSGQVAGVKYVNVRSLSGTMCLHIAAWSGNAKAVRLLVQHGASLVATCHFYDTNMQCTLGVTPLHLAAAKGRGEAVKELLLAYAEQLAYRSSAGETEAGPRNPAFVDLRVVQDASGKLPFHAARLHNHYELLPMLHPLTRLQDIRAGSEPASRVLGPPSLLNLVAPIGQRLLLGQILTLEAQMSARRDAQTASAAASPATATPSPPPAAGGPTVTAPTPPHRPNKNLQPILENKFMRCSLGGSLVPSGEAEVDGEGEEGASSSVTGGAGGIGGPPTPPPRISPFAKLSLEHTANLQSAMPELPEDEAGESAPSFSTDVRASLGKRGGSGGAAAARSSSTSTSTASFSSMLSPSGLREAAASAASASSGTAAPPEAEIGSEAPFLPQQQQQQQQQEQQQVQLAPPLQGQGQSEPLPGTSLRRADGSGEASSSFSLQVTPVFSSSASAIMQDASDALRATFAAATSAAPADADTDTVASSLSSSNRSEQSATASVPRLPDDLVPAATHQHAHSNGGLPRCFSSDGVLAPGLSSISDVNRRLSAGGGASARGGQQDGTDIAVPPDSAASGNLYRLSGGGSTAGGRGNSVQQRQRRLVQSRNVTIGERARGRRSSDFMRGGGGNRGGSESGVYKGSSSASPPGSRGMLHESMSDGEAGEPLQLKQSLSIQAKELARMQFLMHGIGNPTGSAQHSARHQDLSASNSKFELADPTGVLASSSSFSALPRLLILPYSRSWNRFASGGGGGNAAAGCAGASGGGGAPHNGSFPATPASSAEALPERDVSSHSHFHHDVAPGAPEPPSAAAGRSGGGAAAASSGEEVRPRARRTPSISLLGAHYPCSSPRMSLDLGNDELVFETVLPNTRGPSPVSASPRRGPSEAGASPLIMLQAAFPQQPQQSTSLHGARSVSPDTTVWAGRRSSSDLTLWAGRGGSSSGGTAAAMAAAALTVSCSKPTGAAGDAAAAAAMTRLSSCPTSPIQSMMNHINDISSRLMEGYALSNASNGDVAEAGAGNATAALFGKGRMSHASLEDLDAMCGVCFDTDVDFLVLQRCGHRLCVTCSRELVNLACFKPALCAFCRGVIMGFELPPE